MKRIALTFALVSTLVAGVAHAEATCEEKAAEKKLAGAAKASFLKKCVKDTAEASCQNQAFMKKLSGAAKASFVKKCVTDAAK
jgi:hypothetical protein